jgi:GrpB-like predicted nucleotidyltransferase (UPF0157 family)
MKFRTEGPLIITLELQEKINRSLNETITLVKYDYSWPESFTLEKLFIQSTLPKDLIIRIEHFGSTAIPGMTAKPVIDIMVEVTDLNEAHSIIPNLFEPHGYDYFPRPSSDNGKPPLIPFLTKWNRNNQRTHHIYFLDSSFTKYWDRLYFKDYLIINEEVAEEYRILKENILKRNPSDRIAYTNAKTDFISKITAMAKTSLTKNRLTKP